MELVYQRLTDARVAFHALELKKSGNNKFAGYKYFELGDFLVPALGVFKAHGLCAVVSFTEREATMRIVCVEDGSSIVITSPMGSAALKGCHEVQNIGAVETYQRRYLWVAALEVVEHDALDSSEPTKGSGGGPENKPEKQFAKKINGRYEMPPGPAKTMTELRKHISQLAEDIRSAGDGIHLQGLVTDAWDWVEQAEASDPTLVEDEETGFSIYALLDDKCSELGVRITLTKDAE